MGERLITQVNYFSNIQKIFIISDKNLNCVDFKNESRKNHVLYTHTHIKLRRGHDEIFAKLKGCQYKKFGNHCHMDDSSLSLNERKWQVALLNLLILPYLEVRVCFSHKYMVRKKITTRIDTTTIFYFPHFSLNAKHTDKYFK
jgi:hypothetical protein